MRSKAWISVVQFLQCAREKSRSHQQYQRQRYLCDDQSSAEPASSSSQCARAMLEGRVGIFSSGTPRRSQPKQQSREEDRKSTRLNSSHLGISYAVFCL